MSQRKVKFGSMVTCKVKYVIVVVFTDNSIKYVTDVIYDPHKECRWESGKPAYIFESRKYAEDICYGLNVNGTGAFVMEIPDYFDDEKFFNKENDNANEQTN